MTTAITVPFHGAELYVVEHGGQPYTPMKPIVDGMGLDWKTQHRKISQGDGHNDHTLKRWGITEMVIPSAGGNQTMVCMPLRKLPGWLMTIHPNKVKADRREAIIRFQNECDDVLWDYWTKGQPAKPQNALKDLRSRKALPGGLTLEQQDTIKEMVKARIEALPAERRGPGAIKLWSSLKTRFGCTCKRLCRLTRDARVRYLRRRSFEPPTSGHATRQTRRIFLPKIHGPAFAAVVFPGITNTGSLP